MRRRNIPFSDPGVARTVTRRPGSAQTALPPWIRPQLTQLVDAAPKGDQWLHEIKFDGYRLHARLDHGAVTLLTRTGLDWTHKYPAIAKAVTALDARQAYLGGELCGIGPDGIPSFSRLQAASDAGSPAGLVLYLFDLLHLDGDKVKYLHREEFVVVGWTDPEGRRPHLGALLLAYYGPDGRLTYAGRAGTGINTAELERLWRRLQPLATDRMPLDVPPPRTSRFGSPLVLSRVHWMRPELVAEVKFLTWTDDNLLRQVEGLREDKPAAEVRRPVPH